MTKNLVTLPLSCVNATHANVFKFKTFHMVAVPKAGASYSDTVQYITHTKCTEMAEMQKFSIPCNQLT